MIDLTKIFDSIEKLAYEALMWIVLVPKTLVKILIEPGWVPGYVKQQLGEKSESKFDDYLSPVLLLLIISLLSYLYFVLTPRPGVRIGSFTRIDEFTTEVEFGKVTELWAMPDFISDTGGYTFRWDAPEAQFVRSDGEFVVLKWEKTGMHKVRLTVTNQKGERHENFINVLVLEQGRNAGGMPSAFPSPPPSGRLLDTLEGEAMIIPTLIFLGLPMLFAIATDGFRGYPLTRSVLMRSFYTQCYLFSPFILVMWGFFLGWIYYVPPSEVAIRIFGVAVAAYMLLWLIVNETRVMYSERGMKNRGIAFLIVLSCAALIGGIAFVVTLFLSRPEFFRQFLELVSVLAVVGIALTWVWSRRKRNASRRSTAGAASPPGRSL